MEMPVIWAAYPSTKGLTGTRSGFSPMNSAAILSGGVICFAIYFPPCFEMNHLPLHYLIFIHQNNGQYLDGGGIMFVGQFLNLVVVLSFNAVPF